jgi:hypothetical protein
VDFNELNSHAVLFFRIFFTELFTKFPEDTIIKVFQRLISLKENVIGIKEGIVHWFIMEDLHRKSTQNSATENSELLIKRSKAARKLLEQSIGSLDVF